MGLSNALYLAMIPTTLTTRLKRAIQLYDTLDQARFHLEAAFIIAKQITSQSLEAEGGVCLNDAEIESILDKMCLEFKGDLAKVEERREKLEQRIRSQLNLPRANQ
jgi:hypothetical protein